MKSIEILISGLRDEINVLIDVVNRRVIINNKMKLITEEQIDDLLRIIRLWKNEESETNVLDAEKFLIKIDTGNKMEIIKGQGKYPENYQSLKDWISEINE